MTIAEVSKKFGLSTYTLRYYEKEGLMPPVHRNESGNRDYTEDDCYWVNFITLMRSAGVQIESLTEYVRLLMQGDETKPKRKKILLDQRELLTKRIEKLNCSLERLNMKIEYYADTVELVEETLK